MPISFAGIWGRRTWFPGCGVRGKGLQGPGLTSEAGRLRAGSQGPRKSDGWGAFVGQRAETHEEGSRTLCASVSPFVTGAPAWVSGRHWDQAEWV